MKYILDGEPREVAKVLQENRIRADRGVISFTPCQPETAPDEDAADLAPNELDAVEDNKTVEAWTDMKEVNLDDVKDAPEEEPKSEPAPAPKKTRSKKSE